MSNELVAAIIGAIVGGIATGLVAWWLHQREEKDRRNWDIALSMSQTLGSILSAFTPDSVKSKEDVWSFRRETDLTIKPREDS